MCHRRAHSLGGSVITFTIPSEPVGKGRPRATTIGGHARLFTPEKTRQWERLAADIMVLTWRRTPDCKGQGPIALPVRVVVEAVCARPKRLLPRSMGGTLPKASVLSTGRLWRAQKPDADNVAKAALDALVMAGVILDDVQVVEVTARSLFAAIGEAPSVTVHLSLIEGDP